MENMERASVSLTADQMSAIHAVVASGEYDSIDEVLLDALSLWRKRREDESRYLRALWEEGKKSGPATEVDFDQLMQEAKQELARQHASQR